MVSPWQVCPDLSVGFNDRWNESLGHILSASYNVVAHGEAPTIWTIHVVRTRES